MSLLRGKDLGINESPALPIHKNIRATISGKMAFKKLNRLMIRIGVFFPVVKNKNRWLIKDMKWISEKGFTLKELILVLFAMTMLCLAAIPPYYALQHSQNRMKMRQTVFQIQSELKKLYSNYHKYPLHLDENPVQTSCLNCFSKVLEKEINNPQWYKFSENTYLYSTNRNHFTVTDYQEKGDFKITYNPETGKIIATEID